MHDIREEMTTSWITKSWFALCLLAMLASCSGSNGGSGTSSSSQIDTIAGVDMNNNGVRDDVEQYIATTYADPAQAQTKTALMQYAKVLQSTIVDSATAGASATTAVRHLQAMSDAFECLGATRPDDFSVLILALRDTVLDTEARELAYVTAQNQADGADAMNQLAFSDPATWATKCQ